MRRFVLIALLAVLFVPQPAAAAGCVPICAIVGTLGGYTTTVVEPTATVDFVSGDFLSHTATSTDSARCFNVGFGGGYPGDVQFTVVGGKVHASSDGGLAKECKGVVSGDTMVIPFKCLFHTTMSGALTVKLNVPP